MIRFSCPTCREEIRADDGSAGLKVECPRCGQRVQIPQAPRGTTVLGELLPDIPAPAPTTQAQPDPGLPVFDCPVCLEKVWVAVEDVGKWVECPNCRAGFATLPNSQPEPENEEEQEEEVTVRALLSSRAYRWARALVIVVASGVLVLVVGLIIKGQGDGIVSVWDGIVAFLGQIDPIPVLVLLVMVAVVLVPVVLAFWVIYGLVWIIMAPGGQRTACPECGKWWAEELVEEVVLERKRCYGLVTRTAHSSTQGIAYHHYHRGVGADPFYGSGTTSWQERVPVIRTTYERRFRCRFCPAKWSDEVEREMEDFDRD